MAFTSDSKIYSIRPLKDYVYQDDLLFIASCSDELRSTKVLDEIINSKKISTLILINYTDYKLKDAYVEQLKDVQIIEYKVNSELMEFVDFLKQINNKVWDKKIFLDISCIRIPELFVLLKYIKIAKSNICVDIAYSIPYDYVFQNKPFTSFHSYFGDLRMFEILGYSGKGNAGKYNELYVFLGFEGAMGLKVLENCQYDNLILVNNLPSFFSKYKDISVLNNYELMNNPHKYLYTPADNPFETYNLLESCIKDTEKTVCIAPTSSKLVALGVCLYALDNEFVRIVYPISNKYNKNTTLNTYRTNVYQIEL